MEKTGSPSVHLFWILLQVETEYLIPLMPGALPRFFFFLGGGGEIGAFKSGLKNKFNIVRKAAYRTSHAETRL